MCQVLEGLGRVIDLLQQETEGAATVPLEMTGTENQEASETLETNECNTKPEQAPEAS